MENLEKAIYHLPMFDETDTGLPCLEELAKELGIVHDIEATQEEIAEKVFVFIKSAIENELLNQ